MAEQEQPVYVSKENLTRFASNVKEAINDAKDVHFIYSNDRMQKEWTINHNLGKIPAVTIVEDNTNKVVVAEVNAINENTIKISFNQAINGKAYLN